jgi:polysaccharide biosynthesis/export protein
MSTSSRTGGLTVRQRVWLVVCLAPLMSGCAGSGATLEPAAAKRLATQPSTRDVPHRIGRIGVGDKLKVAIFGEPDLTSQVDVSARGTIGLPLIGEINVKGQSLREAGSSIGNRYAGGFLKNPKVTVEIVSYRPIYVHGEVRNAGEQAYKGSMRIVDVVAAAGGFTYRAQQSYVLLQRESEPNEIRVPLPSDLAVLPGDNIRVPERFF